MHTTQPDVSALSRQSRARCILCEAETVEAFLDLGDTALANKFLKLEALGEPETKYPLVVGFCHTCTHVQLMCPVPPSAMFEHYLYISSASETLKAHFEDLSTTLTGRLHLQPDDLVVDIGCNDASLLRGFRRHGVRTLGVDPARNLAALAPEDDIDRYIGFFDSQTAMAIADQLGSATLVTATNTFPHIQRLHDFVDGLQRLLTPGGAFVLEAHYLVDLLDQVAFDTIYHEHISYWALGPMTRLFEQHGMEVVDAERLPIHHGQIRVTVQRQGAGRIHPRVREVLDMEQARGLTHAETYREFARETLRVKQELHRHLLEFRSAGRSVVGYGAPAKGNTLISFLELGPGEIPYIADRSPLKQGLYTPGAHIPVVAPERLLNDQPDYVLLLAWNFIDEILPQQAEYRRRGGKFIVPLPTVAVV
jgi:C-methyltransferase C-terminal domain/Putative zinc binding domain/Methyltransferase domain